VLYCFVLGLKWRKQLSSPVAMFSRKPSVAAATATRPFSKFVLFHQQGNATTTKFLVSLHGFMSNATLYYDYPVFRDDCVDFLLIPPHGGKSWLITVRQTGGVPAAIFMKCFTQCLTQLPSPQMWQSQRCLQQNYSHL
jgi:hypothetical protein